MLYICVSCWLLNHVIYLKLRQHIPLIKGEQIYIVTTISAQNDKKISNLTILSEEKLISSACKKQLHQVPSFLRYGKNLQEPNPQHACH